MIETELSGDEQMLRDTAARFVESACPLATVRRLIDSETGLPESYLRQIGDLGWLALLVPDGPGEGPAAAGVGYLAAVAEARGRGLQPGAFVPMTAVIAALCRGGSEAQRKEILPTLAAGEGLATWVAGDVDGDWAPGRGFTAVRDGDDYILSGTALAQDGAIADWFLVTTAAADGLSQFLVPAATPGLEVRRRRAHDVTQRFAAVTADRAVIPSSARVGTDGGAGADVDYQTQLSAALVVAETVGAMDVMFEMTRQYALDRFAFGRPIGSFQAVKHQLADLSLSLEATRAISAGAVDALTSERDDAGEIVSMAKAWAGDAGIEIAQGCFQVFGGIGYTWEHDFHLFLRRVTMNGLLFGSSDWHRERICAGHGL
jgi:alkylation response protein AidB-like acyl-CoA dehydrogenase